MLHNSDDIYRSTPYIFGCMMNRCIKYREVSEYQQNYFLSLGYVKHLTNLNKLRRAHISLMCNPHGSSNLKTRAIIQTDLGLRTSDKIFELQPERLTRTPRFKLSLKSKLPSEHLNGKRQV